MMRLIVDDPGRDMNKQVKSPAISKLAHLFCPMYVMI